MTRASADPDLGRSCGQVACKSQRSETYLRSSTRRLEAEARRLPAALRRQSTSFDTVVRDPKALVQARTKALRSVNRTRLLHHQSCDVRIPADDPSMSEMHRLRADLVPTSGQSSRCSGFGDQDLRSLPGRRQSRRPARRRDAGARRRSRAATTRRLSPIGGASCRALTAAPTSPAFDLRLGRG